jgi:hypothetical protein
MCAMIAQRGALRTFARIPATDEAVRLFTEAGFRPFATETTYQGTLRPLVAMAALPLTLPQRRACRATPGTSSRSTARSRRPWCGTPRAGACENGRKRSIWPRRWRGAGSKCAKSYPGSRAICSCGCAGRRFPGAISNSST